MTASSAAASGGQQQVPSQQYKYLTTVIPYQPEKGTPSLQVNTFLKFWKFQMYVVIYSKEVATLFIR